MSDRKTVLVVDDEALIGMEIEAILQDAGYAVAGPAMDVAESLALIGKQPPDAALLDLNLAGTRSDEVADTLIARGIPFAFLTGHAGSVIAERHRDVPRIDKPFDEVHITRALAGLLEAGRDASEAGAPIAADPDRPAPDGPSGVA